MKKKNVIKIALYVVVVAVLSYLAIFGLSINGNTIIKGARAINTRTRY